MSEIQISPGYRAGLIGRVIDMHMTYYAPFAGFGQRFESVLAGGLASFCDRLHHPHNQIWLAIQDQQIIGSLAIDGEDLGNNTAHLRWFIMDDKVRGTGVGCRLLTQALQFVDLQKFEETHLWTFKGLNAARHLYEKNDFKLVEENLGNQWGTDILEQRFCRAGQRT
jgi:N-acetylglutamate synthase-like GNAT family acetyltransferase